MRLELQFQCTVEIQCLCQMLTPPGSDMARQCLTDCSGRRLVMRLPQPYKSGIGIAIDDGIATRLDQRHRLPNDLMPTSGNRRGQPWVKEATAT